MENSPPALYRSRCGEDGNSPREYSLCNVLIESLCFLKRPSLVGGGGGARGAVNESLDSGGAANPERPNRPADLGGGAIVSVEPAEVDNPLDLVLLSSEFTSVESVDDEMLSVEDGSVGDLRTEAC